MAAVAVRVMATTTAVLVLLLTLGCGWGWENIPGIPAGRRAEYYLLHDDGAYKFGYDTGSGQSAIVSADSGNQVQGQYGYVDKDGRKVALTYTAGDGGFVPQTLGGPLPGAVGRASIYQYAVPEGTAVDANYDANADASYSFNIDTDSYKRTEASDSRGNIRGQYSYSSPVGGSQALSYVAGEGTGFVVTGSASNAISNNAYIPPAPSPYSAAPAANTRSNVNGDGSYSFSYNTADQSREESADAQNNVRGTYSFKAKDDGLTRRVDYSAGAATGFVAQGGHIPVAPPGSAIPNVALAPIAPLSVLSYSSAPLSVLSYSSAAQPAAAGLQPDGSYSFSYDAGDHSRQEVGDSQNNVRGSFSFKAKDDGLARQVDYEAGAATGFIAKGAHLPVPEGPTALSGGIAAPSGGIDSQADVVSTYSAEQGPSGDATYAFSYSTGDSSRQESSDAQGNVKGEYSFVAKDGVQRKVDYTAGAGTGFIAKGAHLPVASDVGYSTGALGYSVGNAYTSGASGYSLGAGGYSGSTQYSGSSSGIQPDGSYSFSYQAGDHSREESADAKNNVRGSFSFRAKDDGQSRRLDYEAGAATGFIVKGSQIPVATALPSGYSANSLSNYGTAAQVKNSGTSADGSYSFSYNAGDHSREESGDAQGNVRGRFSFVPKDDGQTRHVEYEAGAEKGFIAQGGHLPVPGAPVAVTSYQAVPGSSDESGGDASYSYSYQTDTSNKQESSDAQGNVVGSFSFVGGDGVGRSIQYTSKGEEGFVASGAHLPTSGGVAIGNAVGTGAVGYARTTSHVKSSDVSGLGFHLHKYLPPESPHKFGYIFDTKA